MLTFPTAKVKTKISKINCKVVLRVLFSLGWVTKAKSQGNCGSCAAFGATGLHETCMLKAGAPHNGLDLAEQYIIDCGYDGE